MSPAEDLFVDLWTTAGAAGVRARARLADLAARHAAPGRRHHTLGHVLTCLDVLAAAGGGGPTARMALWFHDAVHDPRRTDNEEASARLLLAAAAEDGVDGALAIRAANMVRATATHHSDDPETGLVLDADLSILAAAPVRYAAYVDDVRGEYAFVPDEAWREGRARVLERFLARPSIFLTSAFAGLEGQARANLQAELAALRG